MIYPVSKRTTLSMALIGLLASGCGINPNIQTIFTPDADNYYIEGAVTRGIASRPKLGYVQTEGNNGDVGSFTKVGNQAAGIDSRGIYTPSALITVDASSRFKIKFQSSSRIVLIRIFAWDDTNNNGIRDLTEPLASEYEITKKDQTGWKFNAADWNQFNFSFSH